MFVNDVRPGGESSPKGTGFRLGARASSATPQCHIPNRQGRGRRRCPPDAVRIGVIRGAQRRGIEARLAWLGRRKREVLDGILTGKPNKVIAYELDLSIKTIEAYRASVMAKMEAASVAELALMVASVEGG